MQNVLCTLFFITPREKDIRFKCVHVELAKVSVEVGTTL